METEVKKLKKSPFFYVLFIGILYFAYLMFADFISVILLAFFASILISPIYEFFFRLTKGHKHFATVFSVLVMIICIMIPLGIVINMMLVQSTLLVKDVNSYIATSNITVTKFLDSINSLLNSIPYLDVTITEPELNVFISNAVAAFPSFVLENISTIGFGTISFVIQFAFFVILLIGFLPNRDKIISYLKNLSPLDDEIDNIYLDRIFATSKSMLQSTFLIAFCQATAAGFSLWLVGVPYVLFWTIVMMVLALIPMVGTFAVTLPISITLMLTGQITEGFIVLVYNGLLVTNIDNLLRIKFVNKASNLHPVLIFFALLGGINLFGPLGFLFGPILIVLLMTTLEVYIKYYRK